MVDLIVAKDFVQEAVMLILTDLMLLIKNSIFLSSSASSSAEYSRIFSFTSWSIGKTTGFGTRKMLVDIKSLVISIKLLIEKANRTG